MQISPVDFQAWAQATGNPYPSSPEEKAAAAPAVIEWKADVLAVVEQNRGPNVLGGVLAAAGLAGIGAGGYGLYRRHQLRNANAQPAADALQAPAPQTQSSAPAPATAAAPAPSPAPAPSAVQPPAPAPYTPQANRPAAAAAAPDDIVNIRSARPGGYPRRADDTSSSANYTVDRSGRQILGQTEYRDAAAYKGGSSSGFHDPALASLDTVEKRTQYINAIAAEYGKDSSQFNDALKTITALEATTPSGADPAALLSGFSDSAIDGRSSSAIAATRTKNNASVQQGFLPTGERPSFRAIKKNSGSQIGALLRSTLESSDFDYGATASVSKTLAFKLPDGSIKPLAQMSPEERTAIAPQVEAGTAEIVATQSLVRFKDGTVKPQTDLSTAEQAMLRGKSAHLLSSEETVSYALSNLKAIAKDNKLKGLTPYEAGLRTQNFKPPIFRQAIKSALGVEPSDLDVTKARNIVLNYGNKADDQLHFLVESIAQRHNIPLNKQSAQTIIRAIKPRTTEQVEKRPAAGNTRNQFTDADMTARAETLNRQTEALPPTETNFSGAFASEEVDPRRATTFYKDSDGVLRPWLGNTRQGRTNKDGDFEHLISGYAYPSPTSSPVPVKYTGLKLDGSPINASDIIEAPIDNVEWYGYRLNRPGGRQTLNNQNSSGWSLEPIPGRAQMAHPALSIDEIARNHIGLIQGQPRFATKDDLSLPKDMIESLDSSDTRPGITNEKPEHLTVMAQVEPGGPRVPVHAGTIREDQGSGAIAGGRLRTEMDHFQRRDPERRPMPEQLINMRALELAKEHSTDPESVIRYAIPILGRHGQPISEVAYQIPGGGHRTSSSINARARALGLAGSLDKVYTSLGLNAGANAWELEDHIRSGNIKAAAEALAPHIPVLTSAIGRGIPGETQEVKTQIIAEGIAAGLQDLSTFTQKYPEASTKFGIGKGEGSFSVDAYMKAYVRDWATVKSIADSPTGEPAYHIPADVTEELAWRASKAGGNRSILDELQSEVSGSSSGLEAALRLDRIVSSAQGTERDPNTNATNFAQLVFSHSDPDLVSTKLTASSTPDVRVSFAPRRRDEVTQGFFDSNPNEDQVAERISSQRFLQAYTDGNGNVEAGMALPYTRNALWAAKSKGADFKTPEGLALRKDIEQAQAWVHANRDAIESEVANLNRGIVVSGDPSDALIAARLPLHASADDAHRLAAERGLTPRQLQTPDGPQWGLFHSPGTAQSHGRGFMLASDATTTAAGVLNRGVRVVPNTNGMKTSLPEESGGDDALVGDDRKEDWQERNLAQQPDSADMAEIAAAASELSAADIKAEDRALLAQRFSPDQLAAFDHDARVKATADAARGGIKFKSLGHFPSGTVVDTNELNGYVDKLRGALADLSQQKAALQSQGFFGPAVLKDPTTGARTRDDNFHPLNLTPTRRSAYALSNPRGIEGVEDTGDTRLSSSTPWRPQFNGPLPAEQSTVPIPAIASPGLGVTSSPRPSSYTPGLSTPAHNRPVANPFSAGPTRDAYGTVHASGSERSQDYADAISAFVAARQGITDQPTQLLDQGAVSGAGRRGSTFAQQPIAQAPISRVSPEVQQVLNTLAPSASPAVPAAISDHERAAATAAHRSDWADKAYGGPLKVVRGQLVNTARMGSNAISDYAPPSDALLRGRVNAMRKRGVL